MKNSSILCERGMRWNRFKRITANQRESPRENAIKKTYTPGKVLNFLIFLSGTLQKREKLILMPIRTFQKSRFLKTKDDISTAFWGSEKENPTRLI